MQLDALPTDRFAGRDLGLLDGAPGVPVDDVDAALGEQLVDDVSARGVDSPAATSSRIDVDGVERALAVGADDPVGPRLIQPAT